LENIAAGIPVRDPTGWHDYDQDVMGVGPMGTNYEPFEPGEWAHGRRLWTNPDGSPRTDLPQEAYEARANLDNFWREPGSRGQVHKMRERGQYAPYEKPSFWEQGIQGPPQPEQGTG